MQFRVEAEIFGRQHVIQPACFFSGVLSYLHYTFGCWRIESKVDAIARRILEGNCNPDAFLWASPELLKGVARKVGRSFFLDLVKCAYCRSAAWKRRACILEEIGQRLMAEPTTSIRRRAKLLEEMLHRRKEEKPVPSSRLMFHKRIQGPGRPPTPFRRLVRV